VPAAPVSGKRVFPPRIVAGIAYVAAPIARLVSVEVVEALGSALRQRSVVAVMRIEAVVDEAVESRATVKPRASSKKHPAHKPVRAIVAVRSAIIRRVIKIPIRANRSRSDVDSN
jgi:hypothetical protein